MARRILITGGAGFIGSHLADELVAHDYHVRVLDNLSPQVHGPSGRWPDYLSDSVECIRGDITDERAVRRALSDVDAVVHFAAMVGVGQSMYQVQDYVAANDLGTAVLLQALIENPVRKLLVASSMSIYGEGAYLDSNGSLVNAGERTADQLRGGAWDIRDSSGAPLIPVPTTENKPPSLSSVYALSKYVQERMCLLVGRAYGIDTVALRFFNVFGTRQALSNPYTGVLAIFASRLLNGRKPRIFEDGEQRRDFVHVRDVARACRLALETPGAAGQAFNVGSGRSISIREVARHLAAAMGRNDIEAEITEEFRVGDIRHCFADIGLARQVLGYEPRVDFDSGLKELVEWLADQEAQDRVDQATDELKRRGLVA
jgi:dTDP-L-rhamnose 4-epimerase